MMKQFKSQPPPPRGGSRFVTWVALLFSMLAFLMSGATLMLTWRDGQLMGEAKIWLQEANQALRNRKIGRIAPPAEKQAEAPAEAGAESPAAAETSDNTPAPSGAALQWERLSERMGRAAEMIHAGDGRVRDYLEGLRADLDELQKSGAAKQWMQQTGDKLRVIREQVAIDGPAAARRLRELATETRQNIQTLRRINNALHAVSAAPKAEPQAEATPTPAGAAPPEDAQP